MFIKIIIRNIINTNICFLTINIIIIYLNNSLEYANLVITFPVSSLYVIRYK